MGMDKEDQFQPTEFLEAWRGRGEELQKCGRQVWRAMRQWEGVRTEEDWTRIVAQATDDMETGQFLLDRLGGEINLEPEVVAQLLVLRDGFIKVHGIKTPAEYMLVDMALIAYYNTLRAQRMLGDLATNVEHEFFGVTGPGPS